MSEDRTQAPSKLKRQEARALGHVARSAELTAAISLLAAVTLVGAWGGELAESLKALIREPLTSSPPLTADPMMLAGWLRSAAGRIAIPVGAILGGIVVTAIGAHQIQVGGLWVPGLIAPNVGRLWSGSPGAQFLERAMRGVWSLAKAALVVAVAGWLLQSRHGAFNQLGHFETTRLARDGGSLLRDIAGTLAFAVLAIGLADYVLAWWRFESYLRMTPQEQRDELRALDGDPALRARRRRIALSWRRDPSEILSGASLLVSAPGGLAVLISGGPPPNRITVRNVARGASASILKRDAERARVPTVVSALVARHLAQGRLVGTSLPAHITSELISIWPALNLDEAPRS
jgi:flagellar biosynthetic protein FlhB